MRSSKLIIKAGIMAAALVCLLLLLDLVLYPCTFIRNDIHAIAENTYDDVYLGSSYGKMDINPSVIQEDSGRTGHNVCIGGEYAIDSYYLLKMMVERGHKPQRIVYELSPGYYARSKEEGNNFLLFYHEFPFGKTKLEYFARAVAGCNFRTLFFPWYEYDLSYEIGNIKDTVHRKLGRDYSPEGFETEKQKYHEDGFIERYPVDPETFTWDGLEELFPEDLLEENIGYLKKMVEYCTAQEIEFVAVVAPMQDEVLDEFRDGYDALDEYFSAMMADLGVSYINFNKEPYYAAAPHSEEFFTDLDGHLNGEAAGEFSLTLSRVLNGGEIEYEEESPQDDGGAEDEEDDFEEEIG